MNKTRKSRRYAEIHVMRQVFEASGSHGHLKKRFRYECVYQISGLSGFSFDQGV